MPAEYSSLPQGYLSGLLAGRAFKQDQELKQLEVAQRKQDLEQDRLAQLAQDEATAAIKVAAPRIAAEKDPIEQGRLILETQLKTGNTKDAAETLKAISFVRENMADASKTELETRIMETNAAASLLSNIQDGASLQAIFERTQVQGIDTKGVIPQIYQLYQQEGWSPRVQGLVTNARRQVISARDQAAIDLDKIQGDTEKARQQEIKSRMSLIPYQKREIEARTKKAEKEGEVETKVTAATRALAENIIADRYDMTDNKEGLYVLSTKATEYIKDILKNDPSLDQLAAAHKAVEMMEQDQEFAGYLLKESMPGTRQSPSPLPLKDGRILPDKLIPNSVYQGMGKHAGKSVVWDGTSFTVLGEEE